jgi:hypothetical protein
MTGDDGIFRIRPRRSEMPAPAVPLAGEGF